VPVELKSEVAGVKDAIRSLNKLEPGLRKQFALRATEIAQPAIQEASRRYGFIGWGLTKARGTSRTWAGPAVGGRKVLPFSVPKAQKGLKIRLEGDRRVTATILLEQRDAGAAILESAGRANANRLGDALGPLRPGHTRVLGPALFSKRDKVTDEMRKAALEAVERVNKELR